MKQVNVTRRHIQRAIDIANNYGIVVRQDARKWRASSTAWSPSPMISLGTARDMTNAVVLTGLAHEVGHCLSIRRGPVAGYRTYLLYATRAALDKSQCRRMLAEERRAFTLGFAWLREHGLPVSDVMQRVRRVLMSTHEMRLSKPGGLP